jgi:hypothetical protein
LFLFKPNLLGEEPDDIQQYHRRNPAFPQEPTGDQFYDAAQWESYRRLGQHSARSAFRFLERMTSRPSRYSPFTEAFQQWTTMPADVAGNMLEQTASFRSLTTRLRKTDSFPMLESLLPEITEWNESADTKKVIPLLLELMQLMEDVFVALRLEDTGTNPTLAGWDNLFRRATQSELFRKWWPVVQGLYGRPFREFLNDVYQLKDSSPGDLRSSRRELVKWDAQTETDARWKSFSERVDPDLRDITDREKLLLDFKVAPGCHLYLGMLIYRIESETVKWEIDHLSPLAPYRGLNIVAAYLDDIVEQANTRFPGCRSFEVDVTNRKPERTDEAYRTFRANRIRTYMSLGFKLRSRGDAQYLVKWIRARANDPQVQTSSPS